MDVNNNLTVDGSVTASGKLGGGVQATSAGDAVLLGSDGKVPSSLQATDMTLSLDADSKILTVTVNGASKTVDLSGIGGGMKQILKSYTDYSSLYSDFMNDVIPAGADIILSGYVTANTSYTIYTIIKYNGGLVYASPCYGGVVNKVHLPTHIKFDSSTATIYSFKPGGTSEYSYPITIERAKVIYWSE